MYGKVTSRVCAPIRLRESVRISAKRTESSILQIQVYSMGRASSSTKAIAGGKAPSKKLPGAKAKAVALVPASASLAAKAKAKRAVKAKAPAPAVLPADAKEKKRNYRGPTEIIASKSAWQQAFKKLAKDLGGRLSSDGNLVVEGAIKHWLVRLAPLLTSVDKTKTITIDTIKTALFSQAVASEGNADRLLAIFAEADAAVERYQRRKAENKAAGAQE
jgi:hypothetical protein